MARPEKIRLGELLIKEGLLTETRLQAAHKTGQNNPDYHGFLANFLRRQKQPADTASEYCRALALRPLKEAGGLASAFALKHKAKAAWRRGLQLNTLPADLRQFAESKLSEG